jgi:hypothetical protein
MKKCHLIAKGLKEIPSLNKSIEDLNLSYNHIEDISPLANLKNLKTLSLYYNQISDLTPLSGLVSLKSLYLGNNQITDLEPISKLENLEFLDLSENKFFLNLSPISGLKYLKYLNLKGIKNEYWGVNLIFKLKHLRNLEVDFCENEEKIEFLQKKMPLLKLTRS